TVAADADSIDGGCIARDVLAAVFRCTSPLRIGDQFHRLILGFPCSGVIWKRVWIWKFPVGSDVPAPFFVSLQPSSDKPEPLLFVRLLGISTQPKVHRGELPIDAAGRIRLC